MLNISNHSDRTRAALRRPFWMAIALLTIGCGQASPPAQSSQTAPASPAPASPQVAQSPTSSTPANGAPLITEGDPPAAQGVRPVTVLDGLERPWGMVWLPDGAMLVTERAGRVRRVVNGALEPTPIAGVPPVFASGQGGLLDIALHPQFAENQLVYFTYADGTASENRTRVARARYDGTALQDWQVIFEVTQAKPGGQHFGSRMAWLPDNTLLVSIGDGGNPPTSLGGEFIRLQAQNRQSYLGKVVRIRDDGSVPPDNPFANASDTAPAIWSYGHRNIQGLAVDSATNRVWASEHGSSGGDELNFVQTGRNYGWPRVTYSREYGSGAQIGEGESLPGLESPKVVWLTTVAPSGLAVYRGDRYPDWQGDVFAGGLVSQDVRHVNLDESGNVIGQESIPINARVRDVRQAPDGFLYLLTDEDNGKLIRLER